MRKPVLTRNRIQSVVFTAITISGMLVIAGCGSGSSSPKPTPTPAATPAPVPTKPVSSTGAVIFGTAIHGGKLMHGGKIFKNPPSIAWVAHLTPAARSHKVTVKVIRSGGSGPHPFTVWTFTQNTKPRQTTVTESLSKSQLHAHKMIAGDTFTVTYVQNTVSLASGIFSITSGGTGTTGY